MNASHQFAIIQYHEGMICSTSPAAASAGVAAISSTSPAAARTAPVPRPSTLMQIGTSPLVQGAAWLLVHLGNIADPAPGDHHGAGSRSGAAVHPAAKVTTARSSEMVTTIAVMFGLNRSQAADVMQVRRQSIYNWLGGAEAEGVNLERMVRLYGIATSLANPIEPHLAVRTTPDGAGSLLRMLSADLIDRRAILDWTAALREPVDAPWPQPLDDILRQAGIVRDKERERRRGADGIRYLQG